eukprot:c25333_g1_i2 orf=53-250(-)
MLHHQSTSNIKYRPFINLPPKKAKPHSRVAVYQPILVHLILNTPKYSRDEEKNDYGIRKQQSNSS